MKEIRTSTNLIGQRPVQLETFRRPILDEFQHVTKTEFANNLKRKMTEIRKNKSVTYCWAVFDIMSQINAVNAAHLDSPEMPEMMDELLFAA